MRTIGLVCPELRSEYYAEIVDAVQERVRDRGYATLLAVSNFLPQEEMDAVSVFGRKGVEGIILVTSSPAGALKWIEEFQTQTKVPVVLICEGSVPAIETDILRIDTSVGVGRALGHLFSLGHRDILFLGEALGSSRLKYFLEIMREHFPDKQPRYIQMDSRFEEAGYEGVVQLLQTGQKLPTAIFAAYDRIAIGAMRALQEAGIDVPEDISVIGTDNIKITPYLHRKLTTVSSPVNELGAIAAKILFDKIDTTGGVVQRVQIIPQLYVRETTSQAPDGG